MDNYFFKSSSLLDEIGDQIQTERIVLVENDIVIQGGSKTGYT